jgi:chromosome segregation protein
MFKLDRLTLSGFKSFVEPVTLDFAGGMTGIVGPNGCGKSNISDAVSWVLGERSAKALRGHKMEDVIFGGSAGHKPLGMAEVELDLLSDSSIEAAEDGKLSISRRVHRDGESQYRINGKNARLKEIRDLLMGTGLGLREYSVIEQGRIGQILSGKPQERRRLLEEAAGVTKYRERRRVAEIKLEEARANLERLDDIISEIERSLRSLKRQAGAARRFQERKAAHAELLRQVLLGRWTRLQFELSERAAAVRAEQDREAEMTAQVQSREAELLAGREKLDHLSRKLGERHRLEAELAARIEGKQEFLKGARQRIEEIGERLTSGKALAEDRRHQLEEQRQELAELGTKTEMLAAERRAAESEVSSDEKRISDIERLASEAERRLETLRERLLHSISDVNGLRNQLHREQVEREKGELQLSHLAEEVALRLRDLQTVGEQLTGAEAAAARLGSRVRAAEGELAQLDSELEAETRRGQEYAKDRSDVTERRAELVRRREVLAELEQAQQAKRERLRRALAEAGIAEPRFLGDQLRAPEGWEDSIDLFLGELEDAVLLPPGVDGLEIVETLTAGNVTGHLLEPGLESAAAAPEIDDPAVSSSLAEALDLPDELARSLPAAYFVESRSDARRLARAHPGVSFIARDRLWAERGVLNVRGRAARPGTLAREHELAAIGRDLPPVEERLAELQGQIAASDEARAALGERREELRQQLAQYREDKAVADARFQDLELRQRRLSIERSTVESEKIEIDRTLGFVAERTESLERDLERAEAQHRAFEEAFDRAQKEVDDVRSQRESTRTTGVSRRGRLELIDHRIESHREDVARLERDIEDAEREIADWRAESARLEQRRDETRAAIDAAETDLQAALEDREGAQSDALAGQTALDDKRRELRELEGAIEKLRGERDELRSAISELRVEEASLKQDAEHLRTRYGEHFEEALPERPPAAPENLPELEADLERLKDRLERTGPVNLLAAEEYAEQEERFTFLSEQRADVAASVESLRATIREINKTSSERFLQAFLAVNESFGRTFTELFRGGQAEMRLLDEDDLLESGIEIVARPPGKRLQNIMLLSGGEKALTAIALLFALFRTKPSPFCILDEVDAPLDDVNTLRFVEMLRQMSADTQFIVITHNKLTMEAMSRLYGVTMQERGISRLVAVDFDEIQPPRAASAS